MTYTVVAVFAVPEQINSRPS
ncbi:MAG: hypothetical protein K0R28_2845, partial [Paenibacillus sp.]|nr:hypothetical protein [Paenibacillus sp.]